MSDKATSDSALESALAALFEECSALANRLKYNSRRLHRNDNLSASGRIVLHLLRAHGPQTVPQLAALRSTSRQNIQALVNRMLASGLVAALANPGHKRSWLIALSDAGGRLLASVDARESALLAGLPPGVTLAEITTSTATLHGLRAALAGNHSRRRRDREPPSPARPAAPPPVASAEAEGLPVSLL